MVNKDELSSTNSKVVVEELFKNGWKVDEIVDKLWLRQTNDTGALEAIVDAIIVNNPTQVVQYTGGNANLFWFFVGQCMKESKWQGNPKIFTEMLKKKLG
jgi:aspartyl-tRNA(Asn)/glutamyl-tRNA(Gln) amidotransferase subunit B